LGRRQQGRRARAAICADGADGRPTAASARDGRIGVLLQAVQSIPGVPVPNNPVVTRAFADAQVVVGLGDKAGWKSGTLSVLKNETLFQVNAVGQTTDADSLKAATSIAKVALNNIPVQ
jgi:hypothetical protein